MSQIIRCKRRDKCPVLKGPTKGQKGHGCYNSDVKPQAKRLIMVTSGLRRTPVNFVINAQDKHEKRHMPVLPVMIH